MSSNLEWFQDLVETTVLLGNDQVCQIKGIGRIKMRMHDGPVKILSDVRFIPQVKRNLISLGTLELKGYSFTSSNGKIVALKGSEVKMVAKRVRSLYYLDATVIIGEANVVDIPKLKLWHLRMGHPAEGSLKQLIKMGLIGGDVGLKMDPCEQCLLGKAKKKSFSAGKHISTSPLDYAPLTCGGICSCEFYRRLLYVYNR